VRAPRVIVVGDVMVDVSVEAGTLAGGGDVHGDVRIRPGGSGANAAVWAAAQGTRVTLVGRIGDDALGRIVSDALATRGVQARLTLDPQARTGAMLVVHGTDERSMVADRGANGRLRATDLPDDMSAEAVLVSGYLLYDEGSEAAALAALQRARAPLIAVEASSWPLLEAYGPARFLEGSSCATLLLANEREAAVLFGSAEAEDLVRASRHGLGVVVKRGAHGARFVAEGAVVDVPAPARSAAVDPTGAGDAFDGVLVASIAAGAPMELALERAVAAGSLVAATNEIWPGP